MFKGWRVGVAGVGLLLAATVLVADAQGPSGDEIGVASHCHFFEAVDESGVLQDVTMCFADAVPATVVVPSSTPVPTADPTATATATAVVVPTETVEPAATATPEPSDRDVVFAATFDNNTGLEEFRTGIYHRDNTLVAQTAWTGDHDLECGPPTTSRIIERGRREQSFYLCRNHLMTAVGDTSGYSVAWFSPDRSFGSVDEVCWSVNLTTAMGNRQWWKVAVLSVDAPDVMSEVGASGLTGIEGADRAVASWGGVGGAPGKLRIGDQARLWFDMDAGADKATRYPACFRDNNDGTLTFEMTGPKDGGAVTTEAFTVNGSFPKGPLKVVFQDHNYTPTKNDNGVNGQPAGFTWHWDDIVVAVAR